MMDAEMAFCTFEENLQIQEDLIYYIIQEVLAKHKDDLALLERNTAPLEALKKPFLRRTHHQFIEELIKAGFDAKQGEDIGSDMEMQFMEKIDQPVFVTHRPIGIKAFYTKEDPNMPGFGLCADLLAPE